MTSHTEYCHWKIGRNTRVLDFQNTYFISSDIMPEQSKQLGDWIEKYKYKRLRINARIPKEYTDRLNAYKNWKKNTSPEEFAICSNSVLFKLRERNMNPVDNFPDLEIDRIYYAKQFEKEKCGCKYTRGTLAKWECPECVQQLSIYSSDERYCRLVKLFEEIEAVKIDEINESYIVCGKEYAPTKNTLMAEYDIDDSQLPNDIDLVELDVDTEIAEEPITGSKRNREEAEIEIIDLDHLEQEHVPAHAIPFDAPNFNIDLINALLFAGVNQNRKKFKNAKFVDEADYQANPFAFI